MKNSLLFVLHRTNSGLSFYCRCRRVAPSPHFMVWWEQTMVCREQTMVWWEQTMVWRQQTKSQPALTKRNAYLHVMQ